MYKVFNQNPKHNMIFRVARHTNNLKRLSHFYIDILELQILGEFVNHDNYNGMFLGLENENWHLEFTESDEPANHTFDEDDLLVFYPSDDNQLNRILSNIKNHNIKIQESKNPYWRVNGIQINDPDGYGIIISGQRTKKENS
jgi:catechol-2,3-dioxygenase